MLFHKKGANTRNGQKQSLTCLSLSAKEASADEKGRKQPFLWDHKTVSVLYAAACMTSDTKKKKKKGRWDNEWYELFSLVLFLLCPYNRFLIFFKPCLCKTKLERVTIWYLFGVNLISSRSHVRWMFNQCSGKVKNWILLSVVGPSLFFQF